MSQVANPVKEQCTASNDGGASDAVHSPIAMSCTPEAMQGTPTAMSRIGCGASSGHRVRWRPSGALHSTRWRPLPGWWCARRALRVRWCAIPGVAVRIVMRSVRAPTRAGGPTGAPTTAWRCASWRARRVPDGARGAAMEGRIEQSPRTKRPLDFSPLEIPYAQYARPMCAADHANWARGPGPVGALRWGSQAMRTGSGRRCAGCAHQGRPVRASSPPCAHRGAVDGEYGAPRCASDLPLNSTGTIQPTAHTL